MADQRPRPGLLTQRRAVLATVIASAVTGGLGWPARVAAAARPRLVVPFPPTGPTEMVGTLPATRAQRGIQAAARNALSDVVAQIIARALEGDLGQALAIERVPGASGLRGINSVLADRGEERSLLLVSEAICVHAAAADPRLRDALDRLVPVATCLEVPYLLVRTREPLDAGPAAACSVASAGYGGRSAALAQAVVAARQSARQSALQSARPGARQVADGAATAPCRELAYNGGGAALQGLLAGQAGSAVLPRALVGAWLDNGSLEISPQPLPSGAAVPPAAGWFALMASDAWSLPVLSRLFDVLREALERPPQREFLERSGLLARVESSSGLRSRIQRERSYILATKKIGYAEGAPE